MTSVEHRDVFTAREQEGKLNTLALALLLLAQTVDDHARAMRLWELQVETMKHAEADAATRSRAEAAYLRARYVAKIGHAIEALEAERKLAEDGKMDVRVRRHLKKQLTEVLKEIDK